MDTWLIVVIVVAAVILLALLVMLPRIRASARRKQAERELHSRRETVAEDRPAAAERETQTDMPDRGTEDRRFEREQSTDRESERR
jgi:uncharacterized membrane protein